MEHDLLLEGKVVRPTGIEEMQVGVSNGKIAEIRRQGLRGARKINAERCVIFPGFLDIHVHLREPGWEHKEDFMTGTEAAVHGGVTAVVDMPNNPRPATTVEVLREKSSLAKAKARVEVRFFGGIDGEKLDDIERIKDMVVGYKIYLSSSTGSSPFPEDALPEAFRKVLGTGHPVSLHCEDQSVVNRMARLLEGVNRQDVHCDIRPPEAEQSAVSKVIGALRGAKGVQANVCHASTGPTLELVSMAANEGLSIRCEATLHHLYYNRRAMLENGLLKTNPPLRSEDDRQALLRGISSGGVSYLVTDHAPHTEEEKKSFGPSGVPGLDDYAHVVSWLIRSQGVDPVTIARVASYNPAKYVGLLEKGEVAVGKSADFTILDLDSPERVRREDVRSKCGWSPYEGKEFPGKARWTIANGEALLDDYEMVS
jgi:dihydroorotase (multifunctional complex type)